MGKKSENGDKETTKPEFEFQFYLYYLENVPLRDLIFLQSSCCLFLSKWHEIRKLGL